MIKSIKVTSKYKSLSILGFLLLVLTVQSKDKPSQKNSFHNSLTTITDTIPTSDAAIIKTPDSTTSTKIDTIDLKISKDSLEGPLDYAAEDSMVFDVPTKIFTLYGKKAKANYNKNEITSPIIEFDQKKGVVSAYLIRDSLGKVISMPTFKQADMITQSDSLKFNIKTGKGITKSTYTQQGEMFVYGEKIKKITNDVFFVQRARFTTCNLDTPHFAFISSKVKFINNKWAFTGPVHPEFEGIPIPIYFPFGILITLLAAGGLGTLLAALNVKYRDFRYAQPFLLQVLFFSSQAIYPLHTIESSKLKYILAINPMNAAIELFRVPITGTPPDISIIAIGITSTILLLIIGLFYFRKTEAHFADLA